MKKKIDFKKIMGNKKAKICLGVVCVFAVSGYLYMSSASGKEPDVSYTQLYRTDLTDSISVKGIVESENSQKVYSTLSYNVKEIYVEVGDYVTEGAILAQLDTEDLALTVAQRKEDLTATEKNNLNQLQNSQRLLNEATSNLNSGNNTQIVSAESALKTAEANLNNAQKAYDDALADSNKGLNSKVATAESTLETARLDLEKKQTQYENYTVLFGVGGLSQEELNQAQRDYNNAKIQYDDAVVNLENAKTSDNRTLEQAEENLETAQISYDNALRTYQASATSASQDVETYRNNVNSARIAVDNNANLLTLEQMEKELSDATITAPIDGTVTAVYAVEGESGQGLLFVIEDTDQLKIETYIKEYDVASVKEGMRVVIKSDSTADAEYEGIVSKIHPAAVKSNTGDTVTGTDVEFKAEIAVTSAETGLKIGMNTRMNIILEEKEAVYSVPFDAVQTDKDGDSFVYLIDDGGNMQEIPVEIGLETDFYIEIQSSLLYDGAKIVNSVH